MSPALFFSTFALMLAAAALYGARRSPTPAASPWVAGVVIVVGVAGGVADSDGLRWACTALAGVGLLLPGLVVAQVRRYAASGRFDLAAGLLRLLLRVRHSPVLARWADVWTATHAWVEGDPGPTDTLLADWGAAPATRAQREWLLGITWRWAEAADAEAVDLRIRAACELGRLEEAIQLCAGRLARGGGPATLARSRIDWLGPVAFAGRVAAPDVLATLLRLPPALRTIWHATALAAAGRAEEARPQLEALARQPGLSPGARYSLRQRLAHLPEPAPLSDAARGILHRVEREILAGSLLRLRAPLRTPVTLGVLGSLFVTFAFQVWSGGATDARTAIELGALLPAHGFPDEPLRLLTYAFLHFGTLHLLVNALTIGLVGSAVETATGGLRLLVLYLGSAAGAGLAISYAGWEETTLGASGAAMGLMGALGVIALRDRRTRGTRTGRQTGLMILGLVGLQSAMDAVMPEVSLTGHLGGAVTGAFLALLLVRGSGSAMHG